MSAQNFYQENLQLKSKIEELEAENKSLKEGFDQRLEQAILTEKLERLSAETASQFDGAIPPAVLTANVIRKMKTLQTEKLPQGGYRFRDSEGNLHLMEDLMQDVVNKAGIKEGFGREEQPEDHLNWQSKQNIAGSAGERKAQENLQRMRKAQFRK